METRIEINGYLLSDKKSALVRKTWAMLLQTEDLTNNYKTWHNVCEDVLKDMTPEQIVEDGFRLKRKHLERIGVINEESDKKNDLLEEQYGNSYDTAFREDTGVY